MIGGHPALALVNTQPMGADGLDERLTDLSAFTAWAEQFELISRAQARAVMSCGGGARAVVEIRALRESLRAALPAQHAGKPAWAKLSATLNQKLARYPGVQVLKDGALTFQRRISAPADLVGLIAEQMASFVASADRERARPCEGSECVLWFVDHTRNHSRHWCRMETCGARAKAKAYYQRTKQRRRA